MNLKITSTTILLLGITTSVYATGKGPYFGMQLGQTNTHNVTRNVQTPSGPVSSSPTNTGAGARIFAGYNFNPYAAIEGGYTYYASSVYKAAGVNNKTLSESALDFVG